MATDTGKETPAFFRERVAEALRHLHEPGWLMRAALAEDLAPTENSAERRGRSLRACLLRGIEALNPGAKTTFRAAASRSYDALVLRYAEGHTVEEVSKELAVCERQAYRDIRKGEADLAALLWQQMRERPGGAGEATQTAKAQADARSLPLTQELSRLPHSPDSVPVRHAVLAAMASVGPLTKQVGVEVALVPGDEVEVLVDGGGLRQCLIAALSYAIQSARDVVTVELTPTSPGVSATVGLTWRQSPRSAPPDSLRATTRALAQAMGGEAQEEDAGDLHALSLRLPACGPPTVVVIDDNEGLLALFHRYVADAGWRVLGAATADEGLRLARDHRPRAIVLDILMPGTDGWAVLATLKGNPATAAVPVIVCSVFNDPLLATALGASAFLAKPVSRDALLGALSAA